MAQPTDLRVTVTDGSDTGFCMVSVTVDNTPVPNRPPTCAVTSPMAGGAVLPQARIVYDALDADGDPLTITHEYDGGGGFAPATRVGGGGHVATGVAPGTSQNFFWDAGVDVGTPFSGVVFRITVDDGRGGLVTCTVTVDVGAPGMSCPVASTSCGDCNLDGVINILDALVAAQIAASLVGPSPQQFDWCNVSGAIYPDPAAIVNILDALLIAQTAAGLPVTLVCC